MVMDKPDQPLPSFTKLEQEILRLLGEGYSTEEIAVETNYSYDTIKHYTERNDPRSLYRKFPNARNTVQLIATYTMQTSESETLAGFFADPMEKIEQSRRESNARDAALILEVEIEKLEGFLAKKPQNLITPKVLKLISERLPILALAIYDAEAPWTASRSLERIFQRLDEIGKKLRDKQALAFANILTSMNASLRNKHADDQKYARAAARLVDEIQVPHMRLIPTGAILRSSAHMGDTNGVNDGIALLKHQIDEYGLSTPMIEVSSLRLQGKALGILGDARGLYLLDDAWNLYQQAQPLEPYATMGASIVKATFDAASVIGNVDKSFLEERGKQGLEIAKSHDLERYKAILEHYLDRLLS